MLDDIRRNDRTKKELPHMATMTKPKKVADENIPERAGQTRPKDERYLLQVDRLTKFSYATLEAAEKVGQEIKKNHPIVKVSIYDSAESTNIPVE